MEGLDGGFVGVWGDDAVGQIWSYRGKEPGLQGVFFVSGTGGGGNYCVGGMGRYEGAGKELGGEEGEVGVDREDAGFCVKMSNGGHLHAAGCYTEGSVLEGLEFLDGGRGGVWMPDGGSISEEGPDEGFVSDYEGLLLLAPAGAS